MLKQTQTQSQLQKHLPKLITITFFLLLLIGLVYSPEESKSQNTNYNKDGLKITNASNIVVTSYNTGNTNIINGNKFKRWERVWHLKNNGGKQNINISFIFNNAGYDYLPNGVNAKDYNLLDSSKKGSFKNFVNGANTVDSNHVKFNNVKLKKNDNLYITLGSKKRGTPLPVELTYFKAKKVKDGVRLKWKVATETNNSHFIIEKRKNNKWHRIERIIGRGTTTTPYVYSYIDRDVNDKNNLYYRLKQVDFNGEYEYSDIIFLGQNRKKIKIETEIYLNRDYKIIYDHINNQKILKRK